MNTWLFNINRLLAQSPLGDAKEVGLPDVKADSGALTAIFRAVFLAIGAMAVIVIVVAGLMYVTSAGNPDRTKRAKDAILYAVIGLAVALFATAIVNFISGRV